MTEIAAFATAVGHAMNIAKAIVSTHDATKIGELKLEFTSSMLEITQKQLAVAESYRVILDANESLKKQLASYERWEQESQRYQLHEPSSGIFVYALKPEHAAGQPKHWLCVACYNDGKKSLLQKRSKDSDSWACPHNTEHGVDYTQYGGAYSG